MGVYFKISKISRNGADGNHLNYANCMSKLPWTFYIWPPAFTSKFDNSLTFNI